MTKTTIHANAPIQECTNDVLSVPRERFLDIASKLDSLAFDDDPMSTTTTKAWKASLTSQTIF